MAFDPHLITNMSLGVPQYPGKIFYVGGTVLPEGSLSASNSNSGLSPREPLSTITAAIAKCTASRGDLIVVMPGYAQTVTAAITVNIAGVTILGVGNGSLRPTITGSGTIDAITVTAANVTIDNIRIAAPLVDAQTAAINVAAAGCTLKNIRILGSVATENIVDCITIASGADDLTLENIDIYNAVVAVNSFISIEAAVARLKMINVHCEGLVATAGIIDGATATQVFLKDVFVKTVGTNIPGCVLDSNPTGTAVNCHMLGTDATIANNANWGSALILSQIYTRGGTGSTVQATNIIPALDT